MQGVDKDDSPSQEATRARTTPSPGRATFAARLCGERWPSGEHAALGAHARRTRRSATASCALAWWNRLDW